MKVLAIEVLDPRDVELPDVGDVVLRTPNPGLCASSTLRDDFARAAAARGAHHPRFGAPLLSLRADRGGLPISYDSSPLAGVGHWRDTSDGSVACRCWGR